MIHADVAVIGGGMAGVSVAAELAASRSVVLVESEAQLAYHSTGRSAAMFIVNYGSGPIRPLTVASRGFFTLSHPGLADGPLMRPRGVLWIGGTGQEEVLSDIAAAGGAGGAVEELTPEEAAARVPVLRPERLTGAIWEPNPGELDVAAIHQVYVRRLRRDGGEILTSSPVRSLERVDGAWKVEAGDTAIRAAVVVNAAGAWGDEVAAMAGVAPVGLRPLRRTAFMVAGNEAWAGWPMVVNAADDYYFKSDGSQILCSPADETPTDPCDARPDPLDIARAIDEINRDTTLGIRSVRSEWAGLRTFAPDRTLVVGPDPAEPSFHWLVGQGGTGIQAAPAAARLAAALIEEREPDAVLKEAGVDAEQLSPARPGLGH